MAHFDGENNIEFWYARELQTAFELVTLKLQAICYYLNEHLRIGESLFASRIIELLLQPLPAVTVSTMADFGLTVAEYNSVKDFVIRGAGGSMESVMAPGPTAFVQLLQPLFTIA